MDLEERIGLHYSPDRLRENIEIAFVQAGVYQRALTALDVRPIDHLHVGGHGATDALLKKLAPPTGSHWLDIGSGIGGPARQAYVDHGCRIAMLDLSKAFCDVAQWLNQELGMAEGISVHCASALDLPFDGATFDGAFSIHASMNISDKMALYREAARVLRPDAQFGIYDVMRGDGEGPDFPVPWAETQQTSFLTTPDTVAEMLSAAGFEIIATHDMTKNGITFFKQRLEAISNGEKPIMSPALVMGDNAREKVANITTALETGAVRAMQIICRKISV
jgi:MPBQ/MSBQ methyltransferase